MYIYIYIYIYIPGIVHIYIYIKEWHVFAFFFRCATFPDILAALRQASVRKADVENKKRGEKGDGSMEIDINGLMLGIWGKLGLHVI